MHTTTSTLSSKGTSSLLRNSPSMPRLMSTSNASKRRSLSGRTYTPPGSGSRLSQPTKLLTVAAFASQTPSPTIPDMSNLQRPTRGLRKHHGSRVSRCPCAPGAFQTAMPLLGDPAPELDLYLDLGNPREPKEDLKVRAFRTRSVRQIQL